MHEWNEPSCLYTVSIHQTAPPKRGSTHPITAGLLLIYRPLKDDKLSWSSGLQLADL